MSQVRKIIVTGGAGFIGRHPVYCLLADPAVGVVAFHKLSRGVQANLAHLDAEPRFKLMGGDVRDPSALLPAFANASLIYHLAAQSSVIGAVRDLAYTFETNVVGTFNVLRAAVQCAVPRVLFASSREVYG